MRKKVLCLLLCLSMIIGLIGCSSKPIVEDENGVITFRVGHSVAPTHPYHLGLEKFGELLYEKTDGKIKLEIFHSGQIGNERDMIEGIQMGTLDMVMTSTGPLGSFEPKFLVMDLPFLFRDREHAYSVLDGEIGDSLFDTLGDKGIKGLAFWENGFRHISNSKGPIESVDDLKGLKLRTQENEVHIDAFKQLGADPTPMAWSEVFTALQQKVIDGQENPIPIVYTQKIYEVQKNLAMTGHFYSPSALLMSKVKYDALDEDLQKSVVEAAREAAVYERDLNKKMEDEQVAELEKLGMKITYPDKKPFQEAVKPVYKKYEEKFTKDLIDDILNTK